MARGNLVDSKRTIVFGEDSIVIQKYISGIKGGRTLDTEGFTDSVIRAGHVIIKKTEDGTYKPMPVSGTDYSTLPEGHEYVGVLYRSILTAQPFASIMTNGEVNSEIVPFKMTTILAAFKKACPLITFVKDEEGK